MTLRTIAVAYTLRRSDQVWLQWLCGQSTIPLAVLERPRVLALTEEATEHNAPLWIGTLVLQVGADSELLISLRFDACSVHIVARWLRWLQALALLAGVGFLAYIAPALLLASSQTMTSAFSQLSLKNVLLASTAAMLTPLCALMASLFCEWRNAKRETSVAAVHRILPVSVGDGLAETIFEHDSHTVETGVAGVPLFGALTLPPWFSARVCGVPHSALCALVLCVHGALFYFCIGSVLVRRLAWSPMCASLISHVVLYEALPWLAMLAQRPTLIFDVPLRRWLCRLLIAGFFGRVFLQRASEWWFPLAIWFEMSEPAALGLADLQWRIFSGDQ